MLSKWLVGEVIWPLKVLAIEILHENNTRHNMFLLCIVKLFDQKMTHVQRKHLCKDLRKISIPLMYAPFLLSLPFLFLFPQ